MTGNNELRLNQGTMKTVVQHWLDTVMLREGMPRPVVRRVAEINEHGGGAVFKIELSEGEPTP